MDDLRHKIVTTLRKVELKPSPDYPTHFDLADAVIEAITSWDVLMELLDKHYPADVFPTMADTPNRDPGPRIVSLIRHLDAARLTDKHCPCGGFGGDACPQMQRINPP